MKCVIILILVATVFILETQSRSPVKCPDTCDKSTCLSAEGCECGTYLGECHCCSFCYKCPGKACSFVEGDRCSEGYECKHTEEVEGPDFYNKAGKCLKQ